MFLFLLISCATQIQEEIIAEPICNNNSVVIESAKTLTEKQIDTASIIEEDFNSLQIPKNITAAAIVNAVSESNLSPKAVGDHGNSVGLFQLNKKGLGKKMTVEHRQDPHINSMVTGVQVLKTPKLLEREAAGATIPELTAIFSDEIMRPKDKEEKRISRAKLAKVIFPEDIVECN